MGEQEVNMEEGQRRLMLYFLVVNLSSISLGTLTAYINGLLAGVIVFIVSITIMLYLILIMKK